MLTNLKKNDDVSKVLGLTKNVSAVKQLIITSDRIIYQL